jgi:hypothetical protein
MAERSYRAFGRWTGVVLGVVFVNDYFETRYEKTLKKYVVFGSIGAVVGHIAPLPTAAIVTSTLVYDLWTGLRW